MTFSKKHIYFVLISSFITASILVYGLTNKPENTVSNTKEVKIEKPTNYKITLIIKNTKDSSNFNIKLDSNSNVIDIFEYLRKNDSINYELTNYASGEIIDNVNNIKNNKFNSWKLYVNDSKFEGDIRKTKIIKNAVYKLIYE